MMIDVKFYSWLLMRRLPFMVIIVAICVTVSAIIATRLPATYASTATFLVERAQIPDRMVGVDLGLGADQQLELVQRSLMTRANLLQVARETQAFQGISAMNADQIVAAMRDRTTIGRGGGRRRGGASGMTVRFEAPNPQKAAEVVNSYVTIILATSSDFRTTRAQGTLDFFEQEVQGLSEDLDQQSQRIVEFKNANADALPENLTYRLNRQSLLQERLSRAERELDALKTRRENVIRIYETTGTLQPGTQARTPEQQQLEQLQRELNTALTIYSETNPRIRILRARIEALRSQIETQTLVSAQNGSAPDTLETRATTALEVSLAEIDSETGTLRDDITTIQTELTSLQDGIERTPRNRITLQAMERELENLRQLHSSAVQRLNQARMGERVETAAKGDRITLLEPANVPNAPTSPNRMMIVGGGFAAGLALSIGLFFLMELLVQSIRRPADIEKKLKITPLITLPVIEPVAARRRRRLRKLSLISGVLVALMVAIWAVDTFYMRLDRIFQGVFEGLI